jgi:hypothetical protein
MLVRAARLTYFIMISRIFLKEEIRRTTLISIHKQEKVCRNAIKKEAPTLLNLSW